MIGRKLPVICRLPCRSRTSHRRCSTTEPVVCLVIGLQCKHSKFGPKLLKEMIPVGRIGVHEFVTLDGVIEEPSWSFDYPFDPKMVEAIGGIMGSSKAILSSTGCSSSMSTIYARC